ncbi:MAG TPA: hypothetical protein VGU02_06455 [Gaiellaceae bacterium]|nr:hypothetical protein [Gaiellaceae bacterium]
MPGLLFGLALGASARRSLSLTYYCVGAALLVGTVVTGVKGPFRAEYKTEPGPLGRLVAPRNLRKATMEERMDGQRLALFLFVIGIIVLAIGAAFDPVHNNY